MSPIQAQEACRVLAEALAGELLDEEDTAAVFYDLDALGRRLDEVRGLFPPRVLHAAAVKAAPLPGVLAALVRRGAGLEAASLPELHLALAAGCPPERIVFDSPAKTRSELRQALALGAHLNADNLQELGRLDELLDRPGGTGATLGLRVNPQVGQGSIQATSVAGERSKFGEPLERRAHIVQAFLDRPWLNGLHMHVGSQGCELELFVRGVRRLLDLRAEIDRAAGRNQVTRLDIGGGLPVSYGPDQPAPSMADYAAALRRECPELFDAELTVFTEFGRWFFAGQAFAASRVEYVKGPPDAPTAVIHLGADMFVRTCYMPGVWPHRLAAAGPDGRLKTGPVRAWDVAGPLCFAGDYLARACPLPDLEPGDFVLVLDAGAYTLAMWSRYNSRQMPKVLGLESSAARVLKERESVERVVSYWS